MDEKKKETIEQIMQKEEPENLKGLDESSEKKKSSKVWVVLISVALTLFIIAGGYFGWQYYNKQKEVISDSNEATTTTLADDSQSNTTTTTKNEAESTVLYVEATDGLRLRKEPSTSAEILAIMPFGSKLVTIETNGEWTKVTYDEKTGWVMTTYTTKNNPLIFKNTDYGFEITFPETWHSVALTKRSTAEAGMTAYYDVFLPTNDTDWESGAGKSSMFVIGVYTKAQWDVISAGEIKPGLLGEGSTYVYTYSPSQATPEDLMTKRDDINDIVKTFKTL